MGERAGRVRGLPSVPGLAALWLLASSAPARAATSVAGDVGDQIWTTAGSPYNLTATVTVPAGKTLTIEAGVCVVAGVDAAAVTLDVEGTLTVNGTRESPDLPLDPAMTLHPRDQVRIRFQAR